MIQNIQTLRVIFAFLVVTAHLQTIYTLMGLVKGPHGIDGVATDGFLIVSAFVIIFSDLRKQKPPLEFVGRRFARLVPFYWIITLFVAALCLAAPGLFRTTVVSPETLLKSLFFIPYAKHGDIVAPIVFVGWTMNYIVWFIVMHAVYLWLFGRNAWMATAATLAALALIGAALRPSDVVMNFFTGPRQISFAFGALAAGLWDRWPIRLDRHKSGGVRTLAIALITAALTVRFGQQIYFPAIDMRYVGPFAAIVVVFGALLLEANGDAHRGKWRDLLAEATFSIYLTHFFATQAAQKAAVALDVQHPVVLAGLALGAYIGTAVLGVVVCRWVEKPLDRLVRDGWRWASHRAARQPAPLAPHTREDASPAGPTP
ncbi:MAG: acyltransferase 3 [Alphaproteobacteria bacterium]|nr:MAG: acyltransferase 3 [Caulobacteraceae bacterium]TPW08754.1 MAG: acyltransferase 3 [Alphaproteobacteria bacterium]